MGQNPQTQFPMFSCPFEYELEKLRREEGNSRKNFEEKVSFSRFLVNLSIFGFLSSLLIVSSFVSRHQN